MTYLSFETRDLLGIFLSLCESGPLMGPRLNFVLFITKKRKKKKKKKKKKKSAYLLKTTEKDMKI
jgi:DNA polymerase III delta subunit